MTAEREAKRRVWIQGLTETRSTWQLWRSDGYRILIEWALLSAGVALLMLIGVWAVGEGLRERTLADGLVATPGFLERTPLQTIGFVLGANGLVLLLHALVCWAAYLARRAVPELAPRLTGVNRWVHERAGPLAMAIVTLLVIFSLGNQIWTLGLGLAQIAAGFETSLSAILIRLAPHAFLELLAVFLPLAACLLLGRRQQWNQMLAAGGLSSVAAVPLLGVAALWEGYVAASLFASLTGPVAP